MSKLQSEALREAISTIKTQCTEKKRKFTETIELQVGLKNYDPNAISRNIQKCILSHVFDMDTTDYLGCRTTVLKTKEDTLPQAGTEECCRFIDLFVKGSEHGAPTLRMVNVRDGLYFIHFRSTLSVLQSFSIAVAYVHSQSPTLRPKSPEEVN